MTAERWLQVKALFYAASERAAAERAAFLDEACAGDEALRGEVETLLATDEEAGDFLERPVLSGAARQFEKLAAGQIELQPGQIIGQYRVERRLGAGGMGVVYLALDTQLGRPVALKMLQADLTRDAARVRRFQQESRAASALNHPNILTIYRVGQAEEAAGAHYIAAEFVDGLTLREQCRAGGMPLGAALDLLIQVAGALATAHEAGIIHRDIKPENLMLRRDGIVKVLDFGLAKLTEQALRPGHANSGRITTQPGVVMGTVSYMSPEQARGLDVDARSDLFSLGVVMYELLTGHAPFEGETTADVLAALISGEPRPLTRYIAYLPTELQQITGRALSKTIAERYQTAREMGDDLKRLKEDLEFAARLHGHAGSKDDILAMTVGATISATEQTTFATHQIAGQLEAAARPTLATRRVGTLATSGFDVLRGWLGHHRKAAALIVLALVVAAAAAYWRQNFVPRGKAIDSVAVMPFINVGSDPQMEYLPDGITESLISSLTKLSSLRVMSRGAVFSYKGRDVDPRQVGAAFKVQAIVTGRVQRQGDWLVIRVELADATSGAHLWGDLFQRPFADLLKMQEEIAREIADALRLRLSGSQQRQIAKRYTQSAEAYQLYFKGLYQWNKRSADGMRRSEEFFRQAIEKDPSFALAYVGLADAYSTLGSYHIRPPREVLPLARQSAEQALIIDPQLAEANASLGKIMTDYYWDWSRAESELRRALELNPNYANARRWYAVLLASLGRFDESVSEARRAVELDLSPVASTELGNVLYRARRYDEAIAVLRQTLDLEPNFLSARAFLAICYSMQGRHEEALAESQKTLAAAPNFPDFVGLVGSVYGRAGQRDQALRYLRELLAMSKRVYVSPSPIVAIYTSIGETDAAIEWLEKCYVERAATMRVLKTDPSCDPLRRDARFDSLLRRVGFAQ
ncbi:MAG: protein kinase [Acidobacteriota bacterium]